MSGSVSAARVVDTGDAPLTIGIDIGGTFVDAAVVAAGRTVAAAKATATPADPIIGVIEALEAVAGTAGVETDVLLRRTTAIVHGTTVGLNTLLTRSGAAVGLLATRGHEDALLIGRVHQKVAGLGPEELIRVADLAKPEPLVPRWRIHGIHERIDAAGRIMAPLDEDGVTRAADALIADGCETLAIAFLWSFRNPEHERRAAAIVRRRHPLVGVSQSSEIAPVIGEYERTAATVVNASLRPTQGRYLDDLSRRLRERGYTGAIRMLTSAGGSADIATVQDRPVETLRSGPVGGAIAAARIGQQLGVRNLVTTDMGGTSFDVGLVLDGRPQTADVSLAGRWHLALPTIEIASIGAGGGSVARVDPDGGLHVGPRSAGAEPGPASYGRGGTEATVTDADVVLGRLSLDGLLGGRIRLDAAAAERAIAPLADRLGLDVRATAVGIVRVADAKMADLIRRVTIEHGHDPRRLTLLAFGGAAGLHVGAYAFESGAVEVVLPRDASMLSAVGLAIAEPQRIVRRSGPLPVPLHAADVAAIFAALEDQARSELEEGAPAGRPPRIDSMPRVRLRREIGFRYRRQTHEVAVPLAAGHVVATRLEQAVDRFERAYERVYGPGTGFRAAGIEATTFRVIAAVPDRGVPKPTRRVPPGSSEPPRPRRSPRPAGRRTVTFNGWSGTTGVFAGERLRSGDAIRGPAVIDWPTTTALVYPGQRATVDAFGHLHLVRDAVTP